MRRQKQETVVGVRKQINGCGIGKTNLGVAKTLILGRPGAVGGAGLSWQGENPFDLSSLSGVIN